MRVGTITLVLLVSLIISPLAFATEHATSDVDTIDNAPEEKERLSGPDSKKALEGFSASITRIQSSLDRCESDVCRQVSVNADKRHELVRSAMDNSERAHELVHTVQQIVREDIEALKKCESDVCKEVLVQEQELLTSITDYLDPDSDGDGLSDGTESADADALKKGDRLSVIDSDDDGDGIPTAVNSTSGDLDGDGYGDVLAAAERCSDGACVAELAAQCPHDVCRQELAVRCPDGKCVLGIAEHCKDDVCRQELAARCPDGKCVEMQKSQDHNGYGTARGIWNASYCDNPPCEDPVMGDDSTVDGDNMLNQAVRIADNTDTDCDDGQCPVSPDQMQRSAVKELDKASPKLAEALVKSSDDRSTPLLYQGLAPRDLTQNDTESIREYLRNKSELRGADFGLAVAYDMSNNSRVQRVRFDNATNRVHVEHRENARLFGFIPLQARMQTTMSEDGEVDTRGPWWSFLASTENTVKFKAGAELSKSVN